MSWLQLQNTDRLQKDMQGRSGIFQGGNFMERTAVSLCGIKLSNPVIPASGTFGFGYEFAQFYDINILGSFSFKGTTREERFGNPLPRIAECPAGLINSIASKCLVLLFLCNAFPCGASPLLFLALPHIAISFHLKKGLLMQSLPM